MVLGPTPHCELVGKKTLASADLLLDVVVRLLLSILADHSPLLPPTLAVQLHFDGLNSCLFIDVADRHAVRQFCLFCRHPIPSHDLWAGPSCTPWSPPTSIRFLLSPTSSRLERHLVVFHFQPSFTLFNLLCLTKTKMSIPKLSQSKSKADFFRQLGWKENDEAYTRLYQMMMVRFLLRKLAGS